MIVKRLTFFGQAATHACDGKCNKAWGNNGGRPQVQLSDDVDDYAYLADGELGIAPTITGITEDDQNKPLNAKGPEDINKWCVRECERAWISPPGRPDATPDLPDFSVRFYNKAPHNRESASVPKPTAPTVTKLIDDLATSINDSQGRALVSSLDHAQEQALTEALKAATKKDDGA